MKKNYKQLSIVLATAILCSTSSIATSLPYTPGKTGVSTDLIKMSELEKARLNAVKAEEVLSKLSNEESNITRSIKDLSIKISEDKERVNKSKELLIGYKVELKQISNSIEIEKQNNKNIESKVGEIKNKINILLQNSPNSNSMSKNIQEEFNRLNSQLAQEKVNLTQSNQSLMKLNNTENNLKSTMLKMEREISVLKNNIDRNISNIKNQESQLSQVYKGVKEAREIYKKAKEKAIELEKLNPNQDYSKLLELEKANLLRLESELSKLSTTEAQLKLELSNVKNLINTNLEKINNISPLLNNVKTQIVTQTNVVNNLSTSLEKARITYEEAKVKYNTLLQSNPPVYASTLESARLSMVNSERVLGSLSQTYSIELNKLNSLIGSEKNYTYEYESLTSEIKQLEIGIPNIESQLLQLTSSIQQNQTDYALSKQRYEDLLIKMGTGGLEPSNDICPNIDGIQNVLPAYFIKNKDGNCVELPDCPSINYISNKTMPLDPSQKICKPPASNDICPNIDGIQNVLPAYFIKNKDGNCVELPDCEIVLTHKTMSLNQKMPADPSQKICKPKKQIEDICINIPGIQINVPSGMFRTNSGTCEKNDTVGICVVGAGGPCNEKENKVTNEKQTDKEQKDCLISPSKSWSQTNVVQGKSITKTCKGVISTSNNQVNVKSGKSIVFTDVNNVLELSCKNGVFQKVKSTCI